MRRSDVWVLEMLSIARWRISCKNCLATQARMVLQAASKLHPAATTWATRMEAVAILDHGHVNRPELLLHGSKTDKKEVTALEMVAHHSHLGSSLVAAMLRQGTALRLVNLQHLGNSNHRPVRTTAGMLDILATMLKHLMVYLLRQLLLASALSCSNMVLLLALHHHRQTQELRLHLQMISHLHLRRTIRQGSRPR